ncbi:RNA-dependent ATPase rok1 [Pseudocyphellaria aurata]|nr:RNA-dependent ATPase rok1 [Pseudocyphellaria aurata]
MDIFKLLAKSTSLQKSSSTSQKTAHLQIPSAGHPGQCESLADRRVISDVDNPRATSSRKRKRGQDQREQTLAVPDQLDFFRVAAEDALSSTKAQDAVDYNRHKPNAEEKNEAEVGTVPRLSEVECRRIMKLHKYKLTLLDGDHIGRGKSRSASSKFKKGFLTQLWTQPLTSFKELRDRYGLSKRLAENLEFQGYLEPTEVQMGSLPVLLGKDEDRGLLGREDASKIGRPRSEVDLLTVAPTGSGKTLAFLIHVFHGLLHDFSIKKQNTSETKRDHSVQALVIAPTHELADQIANEGRKLAFGTGLKIVSMRKGMKLNLERHSPGKNVDESTSASSKRDTSPGCRDGRKQSLVKIDILVSTPLMFLHAISSRLISGPVHLPNIRYLVLDEADILLDPLFRSQTLEIWAACINRSLKTSLWSATFGSSIENLACSFILDRRRNIAISASNEESQHDIIRLVVGLKDSAVPNISHRLVYAATEHGKLLALRQMLHPTAISAEGGLSIQPPFLVFTQTIPRAIALHSELLYDISAEAGGSSRIAVLHSDLSDSMRSAIMTGFRKGEIWVLITTDLLSRGVDFRGVNGVVNYDIPNTGVSYVHRVGRTGRQGRQGGIAVTFYTKEDIPYVKSIANIIAASDRVHGTTGHGGSPRLQKCLLDSLPAVSKEIKKKLKLKGVESRRIIAQGEEGDRAALRMRISTKSGYDRKLENRRKGAVVGSRRRAVEHDVEANDTEEWEGIDD